MGQDLVDKTVLLRPASTAKGRHNLFETVLRAPWCQGIAARFTVDARMERLARDNGQMTADSLIFNGLTKAVGSL